MKILTAKSAATGTPRGVTGMVRPILFIVSLTLLLAVFGGGYIMAEDAKQQTLTLAGTQPSVKGPSQFFTGTVRIDPLFPPKFPNAPFSGAYVTFEPGARSFWHTHPTGQHLLVVSGVGRTGEWGGKVDEIKAGDVLWCPPGVKHWHGASPTTAMTHLALTGTLADGKNVEWLEEVNEAQYNGK
ncbi:MAG: cupin domain-containing protein [Desulfovibrio sp.]|jgi:quercetin dioxygenase-like cupin family protein|nr:cupin domain-containing protein [Desulfovibrio sp.]